MLVSIVIPIHKTSSYFSECIASVIGQSYENIEVIIVCNGKLSVESCKEYLGVDDERLVFLKSNVGRNHARNKGLEYAKGDFIQFLDYDDLLYKNKIKEQLIELKKQSINTISISKWKKFKITLDEEYKFPYKEIFTDQLISTETLIKKLGKGGFIATASWLIPKKLIENIQWIDSPNDDAVFLSEILKKNPQINMVSELLVGYRIHEGNTSSQRTKEDLDKLLDSWSIIKNNLISFDDKSVSPYLYQAYKYLLLYSKEVNNYKKLSVLKKYFFHGIKSKVSVVELLKGIN
ncbi:MAG: glycosyltransferase family 2 protein [Flavobacteriaceae bacterium]|nr:glycosyltransferase family 2 protein [Flavobacteriaceae bacterium]